MKRFDFEAFESQITQDLKAYSMFPELVDVPELADGSDTTADFIEATVIHLGDSD